MTTTPSAPQSGQGEPNRVRVYSTDRTTTPAVPNELLSALRAVDDQLVIVRLLGREPYAFAAFRALNGLLVRAHVARPLGRIVRSALVAQLSRDLDRLAAEHEPRGLEKHFVLGGSDLALDDVDGQILCSRLTRPATLYQQLVERS